MNELIFFLHTLLVITFSLGALRLGKGALIAFMALQGILANLFVVKQISLFGFSVTCSDVFAIGGIVSLNLLQEFFGKKSAKEAIHVSFLSLVFFALMSQIHLFYDPNGSDLTHSSFLTIFSSTPRIVISSIVVFYLVQQFDMHIFGWLKSLIQRLSLRMALSLIISQFIDTFLFSFLALFGIVESLFDIIFVSFFMKCLVISTSSILVGFSRKVVKNELSV